MTLAAISQSRRIETLQSNFWEYGFFSKKTRRSGRNNRRILQRNSSIETEVWETVPVKTGAKPSAWRRTASQDS